MTPEREDDRIRAEFAALRAEASRPGAVPDFQEMISRAHHAGERTAPVVGTIPHRRTVQIGGWVSLAVAAAAAGLLLVPPGATDADAEFERLVAAYASTAATVFHSPTSGLLTTPGLDLGSVPSIGQGVRGMDRPPSRDVPRDGRDS